MKSRFPNWGRERFENVALERTIDESFASGREFDSSLTDRLVVNMARHEFTDYDEDQNTERFSEACAAIAGALPLARRRVRRTGGSPPARRFRGGASR